MSSKEVIAQSVSSDQIKELLSLTKGKFCIHLGCGDGKLTSDLAKTGEWVVQGVTDSPTDLMGIRQRMSSSGVYGQATVIVASYKQLPYEDNLANVILVDKPSEISKFSFREIIRVLAPQGFLMVGPVSDAKATLEVLGNKISQEGVKDLRWVSNDRGWIRFSKSRPKEMDEWTHARGYDASGSGVSQDTALGLPKVVRWVAGPPVTAWGWDGVENSTYRSSDKGLAVGGNKFYAVSFNAPPNINRVRKEYFLTSRDAHNGLLYWFKSLGDYGVQLKHPLALANVVTEQTYEAQMQRHVLLQSTADESSTDNPGDNTTADTKIANNSGTYAKEDDGPAFDVEREKKALIFGESLIAYKNRLYGILYDHVVVIDAFTGNLIEKKEIPGNPIKVLLFNDLLLALTDNTLVVYGAQDGLEKWRCSDDGPYIDMVAGNGTVYLVPGQNETLSSLVSLDISKGTKNWLKSLSDIQYPRKGFMFFKNNVVAFIVSDKGKYRAKGLYVYSAKDGKYFWGKYWGDYDYCDFSYANNLIWAIPHSKKVKEVETFAFDPTTGRNVKKYNGGPFATICGHHAVQPTTEKYLLSTRPINFMDRKDGTIYKCIQARHGCRAGLVIGNGLFYTPPTGCECIKTAVRSYAAYGPERGIEEIARKSERVEVGEEFLDKSVSEISKDGWPTYRHDSQRTAATLSSVSSNPNLAWQLDLAKEKESLVSPWLKTEWEMTNFIIGDKLTQPIIQDGKVYVASIQQNSMHALDSKTGQFIWSFIAGGRIDSAPTIHQGRCLFGSRDGWVYCLRADTGKLIWKFRADPYNRQIIAFGQVESGYPVAGPVVVQGSEVGVVAGRTATADTGLFFYKLRLEDGKMIEEKQMTGTSEAWPEILSGEKLETVKGVASLPSMNGKATVNQSWRYIGLTRRNSPRRAYSGIQAFKDQPGRLVVGGPNGNIFVFGYLSSKTSFPALPNGKEVKLYYDTLLCLNDKSKPKSASWDLPPSVWNITLPAGQQAEAMVLAGDTLILAGSKDCAKRNEGFLWLLSAKDGSKIKELKLDAPPNAEGLSVSEGSIYVSLQNGKMISFR